MSAHHAGSGLAGAPPAVIAPPQPGAAVLEGAVAFARDPTLVATRVARRTYGVSACRPWCTATDEGTALTQARTTRAL